MGGNQLRVLRISCGSCQPPIAFNWGSLTQLITCITCRLVIEAEQCLHLIGCSHCLTFFLLGMSDGEGANRTMHSLNFHPVQELNEIHC